VPVLFLPNGLFTRTLREGGTARPEFGLGAIYSDQEVALCVKLPGTI